MITISRIPSSIFSNIQRYLSSSEKHAIGQASQCMNKHGWIRRLSFNGCTSPSYPEFIRLCDSHRRTITKITLFSLQEPWLWLPFWVPNIECINCEQSMVSKLKRCADENTFKRIRVIEANNNGKSAVYFNDVPCLSSLVGN